MGSLRSYTVSVSIYFLTFNVFVPRTMSLRITWAHRSLRFKSRSFAAAILLSSPPVTFFFHIWQPSIRTTDVFDSIAFHVDAPHTFFRSTLCPRETPAPFTRSPIGSTYCVFVRLSTFQSPPRTFFFFFFFFRKACGALPPCDNRRGIHARMNPTFGFRIQY